MGLIRKLLKLKLYVALAGAGYLLHSCITNDSQYRLKRMEGKPYLLNMEPDQFGEPRCLEINTQTFQVGSTDYRLRGLLLDHDLQHHLERLQLELRTKYQQEPLEAKKHELR